MKQKPLSLPSSSLTSWPPRGPIYSPSTPKNISKILPPTMTNTAIKKHPGTTKKINRNAAIGGERPKGPSGSVLPSSAANSQKGRRTSAKLEGSGAGEKRPQGAVADRAKEIWTARLLPLAVWPVEPLTQISSERPNSSFCSKSWIP